MNFKRLLIYFGTISSSVLLFPGFYAVAQTSGKRVEQQSLELPIVVVQGQDKFDVPAVIKKLPGNTPPISQARLDSLNSLEKQRPALLPPRGLPEPARAPKFSDGFVEGEFGQFITPRITAGYGFNAGDYRLFADANATASGGHLDNAGYTGYGAGLSAVYVAPEKYIIFGGSRTESFVKFSRKNYQLYGTSEAPERTATSFSVGAEISGMYNGYTYSAEGAWSSEAISQGATDAVDNGLFGSVSMGRDLGGGTVAGGRLILDFHTLRGAGYHIVEAAGEYKTEISGATIEAEAGFQTTTNTLEVPANALLATVRLRLPLSQDLSVAARLFTGMSRSTFAGFLEQNPYISTRAAMNYTRTPFEAGATIYVHPFPAMSVSASASFAVENFSPFFQADTLAMFSLGFGEITRIQATAEALWNINSSNLIIANVAVTSAQLRDGGGAVPYIPTFRATALWTRIWSDKFSSQASVTWYGVRNANSENTTQVNGFADIGLRADYTLREDCSFFVRLANLANSSIYLWDGYRERGVHAAAGVLWKF